MIRSDEIEFENKTFHFDLKEGVHEDEEVPFIVIAFSI